MNSILPKCKGDFSDTKYWENFFKQRSKAFEWYGNYSDMLDLFIKYVKSTDNILVVGCGNSTLSEQLKKTQNCQKITSVDYSEIVIKQMKQKYKKLIKNGVFDFICADLLQNWQEKEAFKNVNTDFSCIIDKGTTDAIYSDESFKEKINNLWDEIEANLTIGGRYILITLAQDHIVDGIVNKFCKPSEKTGWIITVHEMTKLQKSEIESDFELPVFVFVFCKMSPNKLFPRVTIEENSFCKNVSQQRTTLSNNGDLGKTLSEWIIQRQHLSMLCHNSQQSTEEQQVDLINCTTKRVRYHCVFTKSELKLPKKQDKRVPYYVFIVPFGGERLVHFNNKKVNHLSLLDNSLNAKCCLFIYLNPLERYSNKQSIQDELTGISLRFCPNSVPENYQIAYISSDERIYSVTDSGSSDDESVEILDCVASTKLTRIFINECIYANEPLTLSDKIINRMFSDKFTEYSLVFYLYARCNLFNKKTKQSISLVCKQESFDKIKLLRKAKIYSDLSMVESGQGRIVIFSPDNGFNADEMQILLNKLNVNQDSIICVIKHQDNDEHFGQQVKSMLHDVGYLRSAFMMHHLTDYLYGESVSFLFASNCVELHTFDLTKTIEETLELI